MLEQLKKGVYRLTLFFPHTLGAYGTQGSGGRLILTNATLYFEMEILE
ncbi:FKBP-type peptidyl-prolyl cis-trans isomerase [Bacteroidetes bacterium endosymbiont of Geopemphigus sp.]|nr:hypothetical protein [Bacteroidetes bacterium endosymbiont of Geopemphigus sp.]